MRERERMRENEQGKGQRERISGWLPALCRTQCGALSHDPGIEIKSGMINGLSHPGTQINAIIFKRLLPEPFWTDYTIVLLGSPFTSILMILSASFLWNYHFFYPLVFVSLGCCNKLPQTRWLKTTDIYSLTVLEARSPKSRYWHGHTPPEGSGDCFFQFWVAPGMLCFGIT